MPKLRFGSAASICCFVVISMILSWIIAAPLWFGDGIGDSRLPLIASAMMFTPTLAVLVVSLLEGRAKSFIRDVGLWPFTGFARSLVALLLAYIIPILLIIQAPFVGTWIGVFPGDLQNFTILNMVSGVDGPLRYLAAQAGLIVVAGLFNTVFALGEEIGWRGWLWVRLQKFGLVPAILISGIIWGLWHAPLVLLGYNYPLATGPWGVLAMCGMCIVFGAFLGWLRSYSGSVWAPALAHGVFNASAGLVSLFMIMGAPLDTTKSSILGWSGWIVPTVVIILMIIFGAFKRTTSQSLSTSR